MLRMVPATANVCCPLEPEAESCPLQLIPWGKSGLVALRLAFTPEG